MIHIESKNMDGMRKECNFPSVEEMMAEWFSANSIMAGSDEVLLFVKDNIVLYCSMGRTEKLSVAQAVSWFYV